MILVPQDRVNSVSLWARPGDASVSSTLAPFADESPSRGVFPQGLPLANPRHGNSQVPASFETPRPHDVDLRPPSWHLNNNSHTLIENTARLRRLKFGVRPPARVAQNITTTALHELHDGFARRIV